MAEVLGELREGDVAVRPMPVQEEFILSGVKFPAFVGGVGSGKTTALMMKAMWDFQNATRPGMLAVYTVPTMFGAHFFFLPKWRELYRRVEGIDWVWHEKDSYVEFKNGGQMYIRPAGEPQQLRGGEIAKMYMDEAASTAVGDQNETFMVGLSRLRQTGFGVQQICVATTPQQTRRWIIQRWRDKINPLDGQPMKNPWDYRLFQARTDDNYHLDESYKATLAAEYGDTRFGRQERGGEFLSVEGLMFENYEESFREPYGVEFKRTVYGIDFGISAPTAIIEWKLDTQGRKWATDEFYRPGAKEEDWIEWLSERAPKVVRCDPSASKDQIAYWRKRYALPIGASKVKTWPDRVKLWQQGLGHNIFISRLCPNLREEIPELAQKKSRMGIWEEEWVTGLMDHAWDAGSYGLSAFSDVSGRPHHAMNLVR